MDNQDEQEATFIYASEKPNVGMLVKAYDETIDDLEPFMVQCRDSYNSRRNRWPGKSKDLRKHGSDAFPWDGASDMEAHVVDERLDAYVAMFITALNKANIRAYPTEPTDAGRAQVVSTFLKWMVNSYIPRFGKEMELAGNYMLERGVAITYVGWNKEDRTYKQKISLEELVQMGQGGQTLAKMILDGEDDKKTAMAIKLLFPSAIDARIKVAIKELRKKGVAEIPVVRQSVNSPCIESLAPDGDFFFPSYVTDPQRSPYCFWRTYMTPQEILNKVEVEGWDEEWAEAVIKKAKAVNPENLRRSAEGQSNYTAYMVDAQGELVEVIYCYQRLVDRIDNSEGIYCTILHHDVQSTEGGEPLYAKHDLMNGYDDYPVVVTRLHESSKRLYDVQSMAERLRGIQELVKVERDARIDRNSMATLPPIMHPVGRPPADWGPGRKVPYLRGGEIMFGDKPTYDPGSREIEQIMLAIADRGVGLDAEDPLSVSKRQFYVEKFLMHVQEVIKMAWKCFQRMGPDEVFIQVTGVPDPQTFQKGSPDENYNVTVRFDVLNNDPESLEKKLNQVVSLMQLDRNGRIDADKLIDVVAASIDPVMADMILQPAQQAQQQIVKQVTEDLTSIYSGIEKPARPNGAQLALQVIQQYIQQPDIMQRAQSDEAFQARLQKYAGQYEFQMQQQMNAQIGKVGTAPASMGGVNTQSMQ